MNYIPVEDEQMPPQENTDYILYSPLWITEDNPQGTAFGFLSDDAEWCVAIWGFNSGTYRTIRGAMKPTHYMNIPLTNELR